MALAATGVARVGSMLGTRYPGAMPAQPGLRTRGELVVMPIGAAEGLGRRAERRHKVVVNKRAVGILQRSGLVGASGWQASDAAVPPPWEAGGRRPTGTAGAQMGAIAL